MKKYVIIGLDGFGFYLLENLSELGYEVIVLDHKPELIEKSRDYAVEAYTVFEYTQDNLAKIIPSDVESVILSLSGADSEKAIILAYYLKNINVPKIVAKVDDEVHAAILKKVGVSQVILPEKDAVQKITPLLTSSLISAYNLLGYQMVAMEMVVPDEYFGKTLIELNLRKKMGVNIIAVKYRNSDEFDFTFDVGYAFKQGDEVFVYGSEEFMAKFIDHLSALGPSKVGKGIWARKIFQRLAHK